MMSFSRSLPLGEWPELDRELWRRACSTGADFLDEQGIAARWRPATRHIVHLPMRRRNMCAIEIGRHLVRRGQAWWITIPGTETKNHRPLEVEVPRFLVSRLERYLGHWRPILCAGRYAGDRLWVLFHGKPLPYKAFGERIETRTERALGVKVPPHAFRDAAATAIATGDPGNYGHAASVLGHARLATTMRYYTIAGTKEAVAGHADTLERLRREASRKNRRTPE